MPFFVDSFTDSNGTLLQNHTPNTGTGWTKDAANDADISSNRARGKGGGAGMLASYRCVPSPSGNDYDIEGTLRISLISGASWTGFRGRIQANGEAYFCGYNGFAERWEIQRRTVDGGFISGGGVANASVTLATNTDYPARAEFRGANIALYADTGFGMELVVSGSDATYSDGDVGLLLGSSDAQMDDFSATVVGTGTLPGQPSIGTATAVSDKVVRLTGLTEGSDAAETELWADSTGVSAFLGAVVETWAAGLVPASFDVEDLPPETLHSFGLRSKNASGSTDSAEVAEGTLPGTYLKTLVHADECTIAIDDNLAEFTGLDYEIGKHEDLGAGQVNVTVTVLINGVQEEQFVHTNVPLAPLQVSQIFASPYTANLDSIEVKVKAEMP